MYSLLIYNCCLSINKYVVIYHVSVTEMYQMGWGNIDLSQYRVAVAPLGGPIG